MLGRLRKAAAALVTGAVMVSGAWAGASLVPVDEKEVTVAENAGSALRTAKASAPTPAAEPPASTAAVPAPPPDPASLPEGQVLAGAAKTSILPRPEDYDGT